MSNPCAATVEQCHEQVTTRTEMDWQGCAAEAGASHLVGHPSMNYHSKHRVTSADSFDHQLIW